MKHDNKTEEAKSQIGGEFFENSTDDKKKESVHHVDEQISEYENKIAELKDSLVRSIAEMENLKKRHQKDVESMAKYGTTKIIKELIDPFEQLFMALAIKVPSDLQENQSFISIINGVDITKKAFEKVLAEHGLVRIVPKNQKFDHNLHQAVSQMKQDGVESGMIIDVIQAGYVLHERVIKPAMVIVAL